MNQEENDVACALVCGKTGVMLGGSGTALTGELEELGAAASELLEAGGTTDFATLFAELGSREQKTTFEELVLISAARVRVVQRSRGRPEAALVAVSERARKLGLLLSDMRGRLAKLEGAP